MIQSIAALYTRTTRTVERATDAWLLGLLARVVFAAVLFVYFLNSALTKFDGGPFSISDSAYFQIVPPVIEAAGYDASQVAFIPWGLVVFFGTYGEVILPILIVLGLFTRIAALGMVVFVVVQSYVDIAFHSADAATIGAWFDNLSNAAILDQRALWVFLFVYLVIKGPGAVSLDYLLGRTVGKSLVRKEKAEPT
ncbi:MAG: DoxX family protein [Pseudomonadota bacterium]